MTSINPNWGNHYNNKLPTVPLETLSVTPPTPPTLPNKMSLIEDRFLKSTLGAGLKSNNVPGADEGWMSLKNVVKSDAVTSHEPREASPQETGIVAGVLTNFAGKAGQREDAPLVSSIIVGLAAES
jgi:hypothetical protein